MNRIKLCLFISTLVTFYVTRAYAVTDNGASEYTPSLYNESYINEYDCSETNICSRKCCDVNYYFSEDGDCTFNNSTVFSVPVYNHRQFTTTSSLPFKFMPGLILCLHDYGFYELPSFKNLVFLRKDGRLEDRDIARRFEYSEFCVDHLENVGTVAIVCADSNKTVGFEPLSVDEGINIVGMIISLPFLLLTFIIYAVIPDRKLHGTALMCYVAALFAAFLLAVSVRLDSGAEVTEAGCIALGVFCTLFFISSFCWMNVMSIDIWSTFSGKGGFKTSRRQTERRRLLYYSLYGWGVPILLAIIVTCLSISNIEEEAWYNPGIGENLSCWYRDSPRELLYFYGPMAITIIINVVLFILTAIKIKQVRKDTEMLREQENQRHGQEGDQQRFCLYIKLFLVMGVNWTMELITWVVDWIGKVPIEVWYVTNFCNAVYGVLIFFLFCFNKKIWKLLKQRWHGLKSERLSGSTQTTTATSTKNSFPMTKRT